MCGIAGLISNRNLTDEEAASARDLNRALVHRGPDGEGYFGIPNALLGMRRLSIIDIAGAQQPLFGRERDTAVLFNGEIYNYLELREELKSDGVSFVTHGDGEVIPHLYERHGVDMVQKLRGMFAISLYDRKRGKFYLFRDRMGEKPIYYTQRGDKLLYASELKALVKHPDCQDNELDPKAVDLYLHYQFVPEPLTLIQGIHKLAPAHYLELDVASMKATVHRYWDLTTARPVPYEEPEKQVLEKLLSIMRIIGRSDVPVGIALSGGIDSSTVAALFENENKDRNLTRAFTVGYEGKPKSDERGQAQYLADKLGFPLNEVELKTKEFGDYFPKLVWHMDDPVADIAAFSIYNVMKASKQADVKVLLNGIGSDEIFWGYPWTSAAAASSIERAKQGPIDHLTFYDTNGDFRFSQAETRAMYSEDFSSRIPPSLATDEFRAHGNQDLPVQTIDALCRGWLFADPVALGDRLSMASSIELRSPFLDHELVELAVGLNKSNPSIHAQGPKQILKDAIRDFLPAEVLNRPKQGFTPPVLPWMLNVIRRYHRHLRNGYLVEKGVIKKWKTLQLLLPHRLSRKPYAAQIFFTYKLILLELWCQVFMNRAEPESL